MQSSLSANTIKQYNITFKLWWEYCNRISINPFTAETCNIISFFQSILETTNNKFGSFNSHRAALSLLTSRNLGKDLHIKRFLKGIFKSRPPRPKYNCTWDPQQVIEYLKTTDDTNLKAVSCKLVTLMALATGQRLQTISLITCPNIQFSDSGAKVFIPDLMKTSRPNSLQPCLDLPFFTEDTRLCVAGTIKKYLGLTKDLRKTESDKLFVTYKKPHGPATKQTLSRWIKETLQLAGVDSSVFKPHSTRHASTSAALRKGLSLDIIRKSAGWSENSAMFAKFYNRPLKDNHSFLHTILL